MLRRHALPSCSRVPHSRPPSARAPRAFLSLPRANEAIGSVRESAESDLVLASWNVLVCARVGRRSRWEPRTKAAASEARRGQAPSPNGEVRMSAVQFVLTTRHPESGVEEGLIRMADGQHSESPISRSYFSCGAYETQTAAKQSRRPTIFPSLCAPEPAAFRS